MTELYDYETREEKKAFLEGLFGNNQILKRKEYNGFCERCGKRLETSRYTIKLCESCRMEEFDKIMCELNEDIGGKKW